MQRKSGKWSVFAILYLFVLLHQADKLLIGPLTTPIMAEFSINEAQMGAVSSFAVVVASVLYPVWGYLFDRYLRSRLLALASLVWGATTALNALARSYGMFLVTRGSTGIDDSSYSGLYSLLSDYFPPDRRSGIYGFLQTAMPLGYMAGLVVANSLKGALGWRNVFLLTGGMGVVLAAIIFAFVRDVPRGSAEPEMAGVSQTPPERFNWAVAKRCLRSRSMAILLVQAVFGGFPGNVVTFWFFRYLETERAYTGNEATMTMMITVIALAIGYALGGVLGDRAFRRTDTGRVWVSIISYALGMILMLVAMNLPTDQRLAFAVVIALTGITMSWPMSNIPAIIQDVSEPEIRSSAGALGSFVWNSVAALSPWVAGLIAVRASLKFAILSICTVAWIISIVLLVALLKPVRSDMARVRDGLRQRAASSGQPGG